MGGLVAESATKTTAVSGSWLTRGLSRNALILGAVSFFTDISSEMLIPIRILFLVFTLGTPPP